MGFFFCNLQKKPVIINLSDRLTGRPSQTVNNFRRRLKVRNLFQLNAYVEMSFVLCPSSTTVTFLLYVYLGEYCRHKKHTHESGMGNLTCMF